jgi:hypothetical protein
MVRDTTTPTPVHWWGTGGYGPPPPTTVDVDGDDGCTESLDLSFLPSTWVPALSKLITCGIRGLLIPDPESIADYQGRLAELAAEPPFQWATEVYEFVDDIEVGFVTWSGPQGLGCNNIMTVEICPGQWGDVPAGAEGWIGRVWVVLFIGLWSGVAFAIWRFF